MIQTPGVSQFFGCTPMGPVGWGIAVTAAGGATLAAAAWPTILRHLPPGAVDNLEAYLQPEHLAALANQRLPSYVLDRLRPAA